MKLLKIHDKVLAVLEEDVLARKDDMYLYFKICSKTLDKSVMRMPFAGVLLCHKSLNLPSYESVTRTRRKIQETHPELKDEATAEKRAEQIEEYVGYARADI